ncbi:MAG: bactofilin family protein [Spirochaetota bacterium]
MRRSGEESLINSIVGPGTFFRGHLELNGLLRIDGDFSGSVKTNGRVIVGQAGRADCAIEAGTVVIGGLFRGEILAREKVVLLSSSIVIGTISAPRLVAEDGVVLSGRFTITGDADRLVVPEHLDARRKELLLESVQRRESSEAARRGSNDSATAAGERDRERLAVAPGGSGEWNG